MDLLVLYGGDVKKNGLLHEDAADRCRRAVEVARKKADTIIIFSVDPDFKGVRRATIAYLSLLGWPNERITLQRFAKDTLEETKTAMLVLREYEATSVTIVSSRYHIPRIRKMWNHLGFRGNIEYVSCDGNISPWHAAFHENLGWIKFYLQIIFRRKIAQPL